MEVSIFIIEGLIATIFTLSVVVGGVIVGCWVCCNYEINPNISSDTIQTDMTHTQGRKSNLHDFVDNGMWV